MKKIIIILAFSLSATLTFSQDKPLEISGSADLYYKYDFSKQPTFQQALLPIKIQYH